MKLSGTGIHQWWDALSSAHQVFWFIAIIFSVLFIIRFILLLLGFDSDHADGLDPHVDSVSYEHEFSALSLNSIIAFFTFFGWTGVLAMRSQLSMLLTVISSSVAGLAAMFLVAYLLYKYAQLKQSGTLNLYHALDQSGEVFMAIPAHLHGRGKLHLIIDGQLRELDAMTDGDALKTGTLVKVVEIMDDNTLKVEPLR